MGLEVEVSGLPARCSCCKSGWGGGVQGKPGRARGMGRSASSMWQPSRSSGTTLPLATALTAALACRTRMLKRWVAGPRLASEQASEMRFVDTVKCWQCADCVHAKCASSMDAEVLDGKGTPFWQSFQGLLGFCCVAVARGTFLDRGNPVLISFTRSNALRSGSLYKPAVLPPG